MKKLFCVVLLAMVVLSAWAKKPMRQWLTSMPDSVMPLLTMNNRLDFIDFFDSHMDAVVTNRLEGKSRMDTLTDDYVSIAYTRSSHVSMKLLPLTDTTDVLCMVTTMHANVEDSRVAFFAEGWTELDKESLLDEPALIDFYKPALADSIAGADAKIDIFFKTYTLSAESNRMECELSSVNYLSEEDRKSITTWVKDTPIIYEWREGRFIAL